MIQANGLQKSFSVKGDSRKTVAAVTDVTFTADNGCITGLLGPNGAGKSTTLRILAGLLTPNAGDAAVDGWNVTRDRLEVRRSIGYLPHDSGIYPRLTVRENIGYFAALAGMDQTTIAARVEELIELLEMTDFADRRTEGFSQGQRTKVALARALVHQPNTLVLDEPTNGLDVMATRKFRRLLRALRDRGHCILVSSHIMQDIAVLCDRVAIINEGRVVIENSVEGILADTGQNNLEDAFVIAIGESLEEAL